MEFQIRDYEGATTIVLTLTDAILEGEKDINIWKISFTLPTGERVRLIRMKGSGIWCYSSIIVEEDKLRGNK